MRLAETSINSPLSSFLLSLSANRFEAFGSLKMRDKICHVLLTSLRHKTQCTEYSLSLAILLEFIYSIDHNFYLLWPNKLLLGQHFMVDNTEQIFQSAGRTDIINLIIILVKLKSADINFFILLKASNIYLIIHLHQVYCKLFIDVIHCCLNFLDWQYFEESSSAQILGSFFSANINYVKKCSK